MPGLAAMTAAGAAPGIAGSVSVIVFSSLLPAFEPDLAWLRTTWSTLTLIRMGALAAFAGGGGGNSIGAKGALVGQGVTATVVGTGAAVVGAAATVVGTAAAVLVVGGTGTCHEVATK